MRRINDHPLDHPPLFPAWFLPVLLGLVVLVGCGVQARHLRLWGEGLPWFATELDRFMTYGPAVWLAGLLYLVGMILSMGVSAWVYVWLVMDLSAQPLAWKLCLRLSRLLSDQALATGQEREAPCLITARDILPVALKLCSGVGFVLGILYAVVTCSAALGAREAARACHVCAGSLLSEPGALLSCRRCRNRLDTLEDRVLLMSVDGAWFVLSFPDKGAKAAGTRPLPALQLPSNPCGHARPDGPPARVSAADTHLSAAHFPPPSQAGRTQCPLSSRTQ